MNIEFHRHYPPANFPDLIRDIAHIYNTQISNDPQGIKQIAIVGHYMAPHTLELQDVYPDFDTSARLLLGI